MDNNIVTPSRLIWALTTNGGPRNTLAVLFQLNQEAIEKTIKRDCQGFDTFEKNGRYTEV